MLGASQDRIRADDELREFARAMMRRAAGLKANKTR
jgi:hypothetical protein